MVFNNVILNIRSTYPAHPDPTQFFVDLSPDATIQALERSMIPTFVIQDYMKMLSESGGRVIYVADCADRDLLRECLIPSLIIP